MDVVQRVAYARNRAARSSQSWRARCTDLEPLPAGVRVSEGQKTMQGRQRSRVMHPKGSSGLLLSSLRVHSYRNYALLLRIGIFYYCNLVLLLLLLFYIYFKVLL